MSPGCSAGKSWNSTSPKAMLATLALIVGMRSLSLVFRLSMALPIDRVGDAVAVGVEIAIVRRQVAVGVDGALPGVGDGVAVGVGVAKVGDAVAVGVGRVGQEHRRHRLPLRRELDEVGDAVAVVVGV